MRQVLFLLVLVCGLADAAVYKTVTESGEVVYSDTPTPGSERLQLPELPVYTPPPLPRVVPIQARKPAGSPYQHMAITAPENDATIRDNLGAMQVNIELDPPLMTRLGHKIQFYLDDQPYGIPVEMTGIGFSNIDRGTHRIAARVIDKDGHSLMEAGAVTVHVHRESIFNPNNPNNPNNPKNQPKAGGTGSSGTGSSQAASPKTPSPLSFPGAR